MIYRTMKPSSVVCGAPRCFCILYMDYVKFSNKQTITDGTKIIKISKDFTARTLTYNTITIKQTMNETS